MGCYVLQGVHIASGVTGDRGHSVVGNGNNKDDYSYVNVSGHEVFLRTCTHMCVFV